MDFLQTFGLFLGTVSKYKKIFFEDTSQKVDNIHPALCLRIFVFLPFTFSPKFSYFVFGDS